MSFWDVIWSLFQKRKDPPAPPPPRPTGLTAQVFAAMNVERSRKGLPSLVRHPALDESARLHCENMVRSNVFDHQCPGELSFDKRITQAGYTPWAYVSENIAAGQVSASQVVADWMNETPPNDGHRQSILGPAVHAGCGFAGSQGTKFKYYWTVDFGVLAK